MRFQFHCIYLASLSLAHDVLLSFPHQCLHPAISLSASISCSPKGVDQAIITYHDATSDSKLENTTSTSNASIIQAPEATQQPFQLWTHKPICTQIMPQFGERICVYTSTIFASGRGLSVITRPSTAGKIFELPAFKHPMWTSKANDASNPPWKMQAQPDRGMSLIATRPLDLGDKVMAFTPLLISSLDMRSFDAVNREYLFQRAVDQLPAHSRATLLNLAQNFGQDRPDLQISDIVHTNGFEVEIGDETHSMIVPEAARMNHDCGSNSQYYFNLTTLTHHVHATRPIPVATELTISYFMPLMPVSERQSHTHTAYHFTCTCARCTSPTSDAHLSEIERITELLGDWSPLSPATREGKGVKLARRLVELYEMEGLHGLAVRPYGLAAQEYAAVRDMGNARKFGRMAVRLAEVTFGETGEDVEGMRGLVRDVKGHWSWGARSFV